MAEPLYDRAYFDEVHDTSTVAAARVVPIVCEALGGVPATVLDVGCGVGAWTSVFAASGAEIQGVDGDYVDRDRLLIDRAAFRAHDLQQPLDLGKRYELVVCLEVAEHLPADRASTLVASLARHGDRVLFSAAIPGQGAPSHVNLQWPRYWIDLFAAHGLTCRDVVRPRIWEDADVPYWFRQNMLVFARDDDDALLTPSDWGGASLVHPDLWELERSYELGFTASVKALGGTARQALRRRFNR